MFSLEGKTALVTGGSSGIGLATAHLLRAHGARIAITGQDADKLEKARLLLGEGAIAIQVDVRSLAALRRMRDETERAWGGLDIFFANAGVAFATPLSDTDEAMYERLMDVNVKGVFFSVQAVEPILRDGASVILNTSWLNQVGLPGRSLLSASKAAVRSFARTLSAELLPRKIRVNAVSPGSIVTPIHHGKPDQTAEEFDAYVCKVGTSVPVGRMGQPEEIAAAVAYLASDASRYMLGAEIVVDGGLAEL